SWKDATDGAATRFRVEYSTDGVNYLFSQNIAANEEGVLERLATISYVNRAYYFRVRAEVAVGSEAGAISDWAYTAYIPAVPTQPGAEIVFGDYNAKTRELEMSWADSTGESSYRVEFSTDGGATWNLSEVMGADVTSRVVKMGQNVEYQFRVRAESATGVSDWTYGAYTPETAKPVVAPTSVVFDSYDAETGLLSMSWTGVSSSASKIRVEFTYDGGATWSHSQTLAGDATGRVAKIGYVNRTYQFRVCTINALGVASDWTYSDTFKASEWNAEPTTDAVSAAFAELFADDKEDDFWFEF
ncbi:MAG: fibronectin type III domain-containing protein, partial [Thermoguttaceae bacterium]|nr:fibronectin type III domain-containing protein [Thermoguttaceae bacterium]